MGLADLKNPLAGKPALLRNAVATVAFGLGTSRLAFLVAPVLFLILASQLATKPEKFIGPALVAIDLPSERSIPASLPARPIDERDPTHRFRFAGTGTDLRSGIPYWIFRIMPRIFDEVFHGAGYEVFGFTQEDTEYYSRRPVPRGMTLSDSVLDVPLLRVGLSLKRVSINCSGCHRGEYQDASGKRVLVDGMPNHSADLQGFKRFFAVAFQDPRFEPNRVIREINAALTKEEQKPALTEQEQFAYRGLVMLLKSATRERTGAWMDLRPDNGPGRIDPFNAVKFEVIGVPDDGTAATLDFPSVWNQNATIRPWHHYDGNTSDSSARNFGSVIGVGGISLSVHKTSVSAVGRWLDDFPPAAYPFKAPRPEDVARGLAIFTTSCAGCHGVYDRKTNRIDTKNSPQYMHIDLKVGTDPERWKAFPDAAAAALNGWGERRGLWPGGAFRGSAVPGGYLAGPLDGIWARAPYLHNGSVPTIAELLKPEAERVKKFYRGSWQYDEVNLGFSYQRPTEGNRFLFEYDTTKTGNGNQGHPYSVPPEERPYLIEYLKTL